MYKESDIKKISFHTVALAIILFGAAVTAFGSMSWLFNYYAGENFFSEPSSKVIGGVIIIALGYIQLEIGLGRIKG